MSRVRKYPKSKFGFDACPHEFTLASIVKALKKDDRNHFLDELSELNGPAAVRYFIHAMLKKQHEHKHNLESVLKLLEGTPGYSTRQGSW